MPLDPQVLFAETKCYACYGLSASELIKLGLLSRIQAVAAAHGGGGSGGASVWGQITGTLSNQTDLQTALNAKTDLYSMLFFNSALNNPADSTTYYLGQNGSNSVAVAAVYNAVKVMVPIAGNVIAVTMVAVNETVNSSGEGVTVKLNKNNGTTLTLAPTIVWNTPKMQLWSGLSFAVAAGDFLALEMNTPAWATNPVDTRLAATIVIQKT